MKMNTNMERGDWASYLEDFNARNKGRLARVELFDRSGAQEEANHVTLDKVSIEMTGHDAPRIDILLTDDAGSDVHHLTYTVAHMRRVTPSAGASGHENALEIEDREGALTILRMQS